jgi:hypothetical protein
MYKGEYFPYSYIYVHMDIKNGVSLSKIKKKDRESENKIVNLIKRQKVNFWESTVWNSMFSASK